MLFCDGLRWSAGEIPISWVRSLREVCLLASVFGLPSSDYGLPDFRTFPKLAASYPADLRRNRGENADVILRESAWSAEESLKFCILILGATKSRQRVDILESPGCPAHKKLMS